MFRFAPKMAGVERRIPSRTALVFPPQSGSDKIDLHGGKKGDVDVAVTARVLMVGYSNLCLGRQYTLKAGRMRSLLKWIWLCLTRSFRFSPVERGYLPKSVLRWHSR